MVVRVTYQSSCYGSAVVTDGGISGMWRVDERAWGRQRVTVARVSGQRPAFRNPGLATEVLREYGYNFE